MNANDGKHSVTIPASLPAGQYLLRAEIIALHVAQSYPGAQFVSLDSVLIWSIKLNLRGIYSILAVPRSTLAAGDLLTRRRLLSLETTSPPTQVSLSTSTTTSRATLRKCNPRFVPCIETDNTSYSPGGAVWSGWKKDLVAQRYDKNIVFY